MFSLIKPNNMNRKMTRLLLLAILCLSTPIIFAEDNAPVKSKESQASQKSDKERNSSQTKYSVDKSSSSSWNQASWIALILVIGCGLIIVYFLFSMYKAISPIKRNDKAWATDTVSSKKNKSKQPRDKVISINWATFNKSLEHLGELSEHTQTITQQLTDTQSKLNQTQQSLQNNEATLQGFIEISSNLFRSHTQTLKTQQEAIDQSHERAKQREMKAQEYKINAEKELAESSVKLQKAEKLHIESRRFLPNVMQLESDVFLALKKLLLNDLVSEGNRLAWAKRVIAAMLMFESQVISGNDPEGLVEQIHHLSKQLYIYAGILDSTSNPQQMIETLAKEIAKLAKGVRIQVFRVGDDINHDLMAFKGTQQGVRIKNVYSWYVETSHTCRRRADVEA